MCGGRRVCGDACCGAVGRLARSEVGAQQNKVEPYSIFQPRVTRAWVGGTILSNGWL
jgi:hypothetical protein